MKRMLLGLLLAGSCSATFAQVLFAAKEKGKPYGYIDASGTYVIPPRYDEAMAFSEGFAVVKIDEKYGVIDAKGEYVISPRFDGARDYVSEGKLSVWSNETMSWGSVRMDGTMFLEFDAMPLQYLASYYKGYAISGEYEGGELMNVTVIDSLGEPSGASAYMFATRKGRKGKEVTIPASYEPKVREGRILSVNGDSYRYELITFPDGVPLSVNATEQSNYREGLVVGEASAGMIPYYKPGDENATYDSTDRVIEPLAFKVRGEKGYPFFNGIAAIEQGGMWAFIDRQGTVVGKTSLSTKDYMAGPPQHFGGLIALFKGNKAGYVNLKGDVIIPFEFTEYHPFEYDVTPVQKAKKYGLLKKDGSWAVEPRFEVLSIGSCPCFR